MLTKIDMLLRRLREDKERKKKGSVLFFSVAKKKNPRRRNRTKKISNNIFSVRTNKSKLFLISFNIGLLEQVSII